MPSRLSDLLPDFAGMTVDRFHLLERLGKGSFASVYSCVDVSLPKTESPQYAIKCMLAPETGSKHEEALDRELELHARVSSHPNIVTLHDVIWAGPYVFMILDLCDCELVAAIEGDNFHEQDNRVTGAFLQLLGAVEYCHDNDVFHRDLKPENILYSYSTGQVYLADFGLSSDEKFSCTRGCGTGHYMSPECIGEDVSVLTYSNSANDVWALGVIFVNILSKRRPWHKAVMRDPCFAAFVNNPDWIYDSLPVSSSASAIVKRVFEVDPLRRLCLPEFRRSVVEVDTFFKPELEPEAQGHDDVVRKDAAQSFADAAPGGYSPALRSVEQNRVALADSPKGRGPPLVDVRLNAGLVPATFATSETISSMRLSATGDSYAGDALLSSAGSSYDLVTPMGHTVDRGCVATTTNMASFAPSMPPAGIDPACERQRMIGDMAERLKGLEVRSRAVGDALDARIQKNRALLCRLIGQYGQLRSGVL
ncbi:kinase-like domain-containing protein [Schizophyllum amplum]|uniref:non-specific serine/threonine protein kinase n=1 Tax=Schizophyllum amplum TaxID=97359 RepID=A0A550C2Y7_9AGAR|nr:kinase-like domain-containing protein [Auriculariopsis ampla]